MQMIILTVCPYTDINHKALSVHLAAVTVYCRQLDSVSATDWQHQRTPFKRSCWCLHAGAFSMTLKHHCSPSGSHNVLCLAWQLNAAGTGGS